MFLTKEDGSVVQVVQKISALEVTTQFGSLVAAMESTNGLAPIGPRSVVKQETLQLTTKADLM